ncbi:hypothetical protein ACQPYE_18960 [Actinosynnema sp. CA-299493]
MAAPDRGWPFLVARGRRRGYSVLLAPSFLIDDHGLLEEVVGPVPDVRVASVRNAGGRWLCVVWAAHTATEAEIGNPRDEHSRPLRLLYGFVCPDGVVERPSEAGMTASLAGALDTYRRFLEDEERFTVEASTPIDLGPPVLARAQPRTIAPPPAPQHPCPRRWQDTVLVLLAGLVVAIIGIRVLADDSSDQGPPPPCLTFDTRVTGTTTAPPSTPIPAPPC